MIEWKKVEETTDNVDGEVYCILQKYQSSHLNFFLGSGSQSSSVQSVTGCRGILGTFVGELMLNTMLYITQGDQIPVQEETHKVILSCLGC
jgi:hypothetical protein